jgi:hypothetical protein
MDLSLSWAWNQDEAHNVDITWTLDADQIPLLNPLTLLTLIFVFDKLIYPFLRFIGVRF